MTKEEAIAIAEGAMSPEQRELYGFKSVEWVPKVVTLAMSIDAKYGVRYSRRHPVSDSSGNELELDMVVYVCPDTKIALIKFPLE
jgi:hypothetical protein